MNKCWIIEGKLDEKDCNWCAVPWISIDRRTFNTVFLRKKNAKHTLNEIRSSLAEAKLTDVIYRIKKYKRQK